MSEALRAEFGVSVKENHPTCKGHSMPDNYREISSDVFSGSSDDSDASENYLDSDSPVGSRRE